jgi:hypothetical protein
MAGMKHLIGSTLRGFLWVFISRAPKLWLKAAGYELFRVSDAPSEFATRGEAVFPALRTQVHKNRRFGETLDESVATTTFPEVSLLRFSDARVIDNSRFNSVALGSRILIPPRQEAGPWALYKGRKPRIVANIVGQRGDMLLRRRESTAIGVERALYIGSRAPYNWYHWLINLLPALHIANLAGVDERVPLLLPSRVKQTVQMLESLEVFRRGREVLWIPDDAVVQVQDLYWPESPVFDSPFSIARSSRRPLALHPEAMESFRDELLEHFRHLPAPARSERVYLARRPGSSRPFNGEEVETWAIELGFRVVFVEELSFSDQVALFRGAEFVIGPTGAAFTNMLFAPAKARGLRFVGKAEPFENYFSNLSTVCGARILDVVGTPSNLKGGDEGFTLSREAFLRAVEFLLDSK